MADHSKIAYFNRGCLRTGLIGSRTVLTDGSLQYHCQLMRAVLPSFNPAKRTLSFHTQSLF